MQGSGSARGVLRGAGRPVQFGRTHTAQLLLRVGGAWQCPRNAEVLSGCPERNLLEGDPEWKWTAASDLLLTSSLPPVSREGVWDLSRYTGTCPRLG